MPGRVRHNFATNPAQLRDRFRELSAQQMKSRKIVETIESMGTAILSLDGSEHDRDPEVDSVAIERDGLLAYVEGAADLDLVFSLNILDERGDQSKEYSKEMTFLAEPDVWGDTYKVVGQEQTEVVVQNSDGLLAYQSLTSEPTARASAAQQGEAHTARALKPGPRGLRRLSKAKPTPRGL